MKPSLETLFLPLENGDVAFESPALLLGGAAHPYLAHNRMDVWQPFKPLTYGIDTISAVPTDKTYALALVDLPKQAEEARHWLAIALRRLKPGGVLLTAAANDAGGARLQKWFEEAGLEPSSLSKNKCRVVWAKRPAILSPIIEDWYYSGLQREINGDGIELKSQPGLFSWDRIDAGSKMLMDNLPTNLSGTGADFGAGIGVLSRHVLQNNRGVKSLYVLEADCRALECAKENLDPVRGDVALHFGWEDLTQPLSKIMPSLNFVIMNPPFHEGKKTANSIGGQFIGNAARALKKGGALWMVANTHLPYEEILAKNFARVRPVITKNGFKIIEAVK